MENQDECDELDSLLEPQVAEIAPNKSEVLPNKQVVSKKQQKESVHDEQLITPQLKRGPGRPRLVSTGQKGKRKKIYNMVPIKLNLEAETTQEDEKNEEKKDDVFDGAEEEVQYANLAEISMQEAMSSSSKNEWKDLR